MPCDTFREFITVGFPESLDPAFKDSLVFARVKIENDVKEKEFLRRFRIFAKIKKLERRKL